MGRFYFNFLRFLGYLLLVSKTCCLFFIKYALFSARHVQTFSISEQLNHVQTLFFCNYCIFDIWKAKTYNLLLFHVKQVVCHAFSKPFYRILNKYSLIFVCNYCFQYQRQRNWVSKAFIRNSITRNNLIKTCINLSKGLCFYEQHQTIFIYAS